MRPGRSPVHALARQLLSSGTDSSSAAAAARAEVDELVGRILATPAVAGLRLASLAAGTESRVLLIVDQLEELFTHETDARERACFLEALFRAADEITEPVRVILVVRDDFVGRLSRLSSTFVLVSPSRDALRRAVIKPLEQVGYAFDDPAIVEAMLGELERGSAELPLIQFALRRLWDSRDEASRTLSRGAYERMGGVAGALADYADTLLAGLDHQELSAAKQLLLRLVSPESTRMISERSRLLSELGAAGERSLARLIDGRLIIQGRSKDSGEPTVELAHESLIHRWERLAKWLESGREERAFSAELRAAAELWIQRGRRAEETWDKEALSAVRHRIRRLGLVLEEDARAFIAAGEARQKKSRTRRWVAVIAALTILTATTAGALRQNEELRAAGANLGEMDLSLELFDLDPVSRAPRLVDLSELPELAFTFHDPSPADTRESGPPILGEQVRVGAMTAVAANRRNYHVFARGGPAFLRVDGRGQRGEKCPASWIRIQSLPGYAERQRHERPELRVRVPTCRATWHDMVEIPAGRFIYGGRGDPPLADGELTEPETTISLPKFFIDRAEISNAAF